MGFLGGIVEQGYSPRAVGLDAPWNAFVNGTNAVLWDGSWMLQNMKDVRGGVLVAAFPQIGEQRAVWANAHQLVMFAKRALDPNRVQASMVFLRFLTQQGLTWAKAGVLPARTALLQSEALRAHPATHSLVKSLPDVRFLPQGPAIGELHDDILQHAVDASLRAKDPAARLSFAQHLASDELLALRAPFER
jgi:multiple sugar transport system substrate-binding protein